MKNLQLPLTEDAVRGLALGDAVSLTGTIYTARDAAHKYLVENPDFSRIPDLRGQGQRVHFLAGGIVVGVLRFDIDLAVR